jgi:hypothetical protein
MKPLLLIQPRFGGDVFFCMKIAAVCAARGQRVIFPVEDQFAWIPQSLNIPAGVEMPLMSEDFDHKDLYLGVRYQAEMSSSQKDWRFHNSPLENESCMFLALDSSWKKSPQDTMILKYLIAGIEYADWADYVSLKRDPEREQKLLDHLGITEDREFTLINENCRTRTINVPCEGDAIRMGVVPGFTLFDWAAVAERAKEIITVDTAFVLLLEVLKLKQPLQMISRYEPPTFQPIQPLLRLDWHLALTVDDLRQ